MKKLLCLVALGLFVSNFAGAATERSLIDYQDMSCDALINNPTNDSFVSFARNEITSMIEGDYCELRIAGNSEKDFDGPEFARAGINEAAHSKLIEALYVEFLGL